MLTHSHSRPEDEPESEVRPGESGSEAAAPLLVALLPASRRQELRYVWPVIAEAAALMRREAEGEGGLRQRPVEGADRDREGGHSAE